MTSSARPVTSSLRPSRTSVGDGDLGDECDDDDDCKSGRCFEDRERTSPSTCRCSKTGEGCAQDEYCELSDDGVPTCVSQGPPVVELTVTATNAAASATCSDYSNCTSCVDDDANGLDCKWSANSCFDECPMDVSCYAQPESCPVDQALCDSANTSCAACVELGCTWQQETCRSECEFGPLGAFLADCYSVDATECPSSAGSNNATGGNATEAAEGSLDLVFTTQTNSSISDNSTSSEEAGSTLISTDNATAADGNNTTDEGTSMKTDNVTVTDDANSTETNATSTTNEEEENVFFHNSTNSTMQDGSNNITSSFNSTHNGTMDGGGASHNVTTDDDDEPKSHNNNTSDNSTTAMPDGSTNGTSANSTDDGTTGGGGEEEHNNNATDTDTTNATNTTTVDEDDAPIILYTATFDANTTITQNRRNKIKPVPQGRAGKSLRGVEGNILEFKLSSQGKSRASDGEMEVPVQQLTQVMFQSRVGMSKPKRGKIKCVPQLGLRDEENELVILKGRHFFVNKNAHRNAQVIQRVLTIPPGRSGLEIRQWVLICSVRLPKNSSKKPQKMLIAEVVVRTVTPGELLRDSDRDTQNSDRVREPKEIDRRRIRA